MPLMDIIGQFILIYFINILINIGVDHCNRSFFVAFTFLSDESEGSYIWSLTQLKELYSLLQPTIGLVLPN